MHCGLGTSIISLYHQASIINSHPHSPDEQIEALKICFLGPLLIGLLQVTNPVYRIEMIKCLTHCKYWFTLGSTTSQGQRPDTPKSSHASGLICAIHHPDLQQSSFTPAQFCAGQEGFSPHLHSAFSFSTLSTVKRKAIKKHHAALQAPNKRRAYQELAATGSNQNSRQLLMDVYFWYNHFREMFGNVYEG